MTTEKAHAKFSASGADRWLNCPGSIAMCDGVPEQPESAYAAEGTKAHECLEEILSKKPRTKAGYVKKYGLEMYEYALDAAHWIINQATQTGGKVICETKINSSPFTTEGQFGTLDAAIIRDFDRLTVVDYKYGMGIAVDPEYDGDCNPQLAYYALGLSYEYFHNFSEIELVIIQPRAYHESGETIRTAVFSMRHMLEWAEKFRAGVKAALDPLAPTKAGRWCKFCPAAFKCPELKDKAIKEAQVVFNDGVIVIPDPKQLANEQIGLALDAAAKIEIYIEALRAHAAHQLERGLSVPGWKLVQKRSIRKWTNEEVARTEAIQLFDSRALTEPKLLSPAQLEKVAGKSWVNARVTAESSGTTLVHETDLRPAVRPMDQIFLSEVK